MSDISILMVEDDQGQQSLYRDAIDDYNNDNSNEKKIVLDIADTSDDAIEKLDQKHYDAIFLDLILKGDPIDRSSASGNDVLKYILDNKSKLRLAVYVISGTLGSVSQDYDDDFDNPLMRKFERSEDTSIVIDDLIRVWDTGVTKILGGSGKLEELISDIFFNHLSKGFNFWVHKDRDCEKELLRYTALHLLEYLDEPTPENNEDLKYFNPEFYIYPPIKKPIATGDIISIDGGKHVILSPSCDITPREGENGKPIFNVEVVVLAEIIPLEKTVFESMSISYSSSGKTDSGAWKKFLSNQRGTSPKQRYHYLPQYLEIDEAVIDFTRITYRPICNVLNDERIATISSPFVRDVQSRFSAYFGRQGQPVGEWSV